MTRLQKISILGQLAELLNERGSWCGETHLQKGTYLAQELLNVPLAFDFILYKHGPFSFGLRDELTAMTADSQLAVVPRPYPYGPSLLPTDENRKLRESFAVTLARYLPALRFIAEAIGDKGVAELERIATALYVQRKAGQWLTDEVIARRINELKPHVSLESAKWAASELDRIRAQAGALHAEAQ